MVEPPQDPDDLRAAVKKLEDRSYSTFKARVAAHERLNARNHAWNASMVALSAAVAVASIGVLTDPGMYGARGETVLAALGVMSLVASLVVANANYGARSRNMESNFKRIQELSVIAEGFFVNAATATCQEYERLRREYHSLIDAAENHTSGDHHRAQTTGAFPALRWKCLKETLVTTAPYLSLALPIGLLVPFVRAVSHG